MSDKNPRAKMQAHLMISITVTMLMQWDAAEFKQQGPAKYAEALFREIWRNIEDVDKNKTGFKEISDKTIQIVSQIMEPVMFSRIDKWIKNCVKTWGGKQGITESTLDKLDNFQKCLLRMGCHKAMHSEKPELVGKNMTLIANEVYGSTREGRQHLTPVIALFGIFHAIKDHVHDIPISKPAANMASTTQNDYTATTTVPPAPPPPAYPARSAAPPSFMVNPTPPMVNPMLHAQQMMQAQAMGGYNPMMMNNPMLAHMNQAAMMPHAHMNPAMMMSMNPVMAMNMMRGAGMAASKGAAMRSRGTVPMMYGGKGGEHVDMQQPHKPAQTAAGPLATGSARPVTAPKGKKRDAKSGSSSSSSSGSSSGSDDDSSSNESDASDSSQRVRKRRQKPVPFPGDRKPAGHAEIAAKVRAKGKEDGDDGGDEQDKKTPQEATKKKIKEGADEDAVPDGVKSAPLPGALNSDDDATPRLKIPTKNTGEMKINTQNMAETAIKAQHGALDLLEKGTQTEKNPDADGNCIIWRFRKPKRKRRKQMAG